MKTIEEKRRALFEAWAVKNGYEERHLVIVDGVYRGPAAAIAWRAFNAALDSVVISYRVV